MKTKAFKHHHPYPPFIPEGTQKLIVGTLPPPRFAVGELFPEDVDFCYGSKYGLLWPILESIFNRKIDYENTNTAIEQRKRLLADNKIGICDMVESCIRNTINASDLGMTKITLRNLIAILSMHPTIDTILFMGGNTKNGPEYLFRKHLKLHKLSLQPVQIKDPRIHKLFIHERQITCTSLISPSNAANRSIGAHPHYKKMKALNKSYTTLDFRKEMYQSFFS